MKFFLMLALLVMGLWGCKDDKTDGVKLVNNVVMPSVEMVFSAGGEVTVEADGFESGDGVMIRRGAVILDAEVLEVRSTQIRFVVPSGLPAGKVDVLLTRGGRYMVLGQIAVTDGRAPDRYSLYGISLQENLTVIDTISMLSGQIKRIATLDAGQYLLGAVNAVGTNNIYGVNDGKAVQYNLTTTRYRDSGVGNVLAMGTIGLSSPVYLRSIDNRIVLENSGLTRSIAAPTLSWTLPEGITPEMLVGNGFVSTTDNYLILAARLAAGSYSPVVLELKNPFRIKVGDPIIADGFVPFRMGAQLEGGTNIAIVGGFATSQGGVTTLRQFNPATMTFREIFIEGTCEVPGTVLSCSGWITGEGTERFYLLRRTDAGVDLSCYDLSKKTLTTLVEDAPFAEILLAR